jgi:integrase
MRISRLSALAVKQAMRKRERGKVADGGNLYLQDGSAWVFRYERDGRERFMGLGSALDVTLAEARDRARDARRLLARAVDPLDRRRDAEAAAATPTFAAFAAEHIAAHESGWSAEHAKRWTQSLAKDAYPVIGAMRIDAITVDDVLRMLTPLWREKPVTADRLRNKVELVLDAARAKGLRTGENPARWKGHLDKLMPAARRVAPVKHHAALPHREIAALMADLRRQEGIAPAALRFTILTAARTGEVLGATWSEVDVEQKVWLIPATRTKQRKPHRVPLSTAALAIVDEMAAIRMGDFVFPSARKRNGPMSPTALLVALRAAGGADVVVHAMRASFRTWVAEATDFPSDLAEMALGHQVGNTVERSYQRSDQFERRRALMQAWADYCDRQGAVVPLRA